jgi:hypothetical protein
MALAFAYTDTVIEHPHRVPESTRTIVCLCCGDTMKHLRTLPRLGARREKLIFVCSSCKGIDTKELISVPMPTRRAHDPACVHRNRHPPAIPLHPE